MRLSTLNLAAGVNQDFYCSGGFFSLLSASVAIQATFYGPGVDIFTEVLPGLSFPLPRFDRIVIKSETAQEILIGISDFPVSDNRMVGAVDANIVSGSGLVTLADELIVAGAAARVILPQLSGRKWAYIGSLQANTGLARIGDSNTGAARGTEIAAGELISLPTEAAIYAYVAAGAGNQTLTVKYLT